MAKVKTVTMKFPASGSADVVGYNLYMEEVPAPVTFASEKFDIGNDVVNGTVSIDLSTLPGMTSKDGRYNFSVAAVDDAGNESSFSIINDVPIDFIAPDPPGDLEIIRQ